MKGTYLLGRLLRACATLGFILVVVFVATRLTGDPTEWMLGDMATTEQRAALRVHLGLDRSIPEQFVVYVKQLARGDFGNSFYEHRPVLEVLAERLPPTFQLMSLALLLGIAIGLAIGILAAVFQDSWIDRVLMLTVFCLYAVPNFVFAILGILVFSLTLRWLPSSGYGSAAHFVMPLLTLSAGYSALVARITRSSMLDTLGQDYARTALSKGLRRQTVILKHCLRNALSPVLTIVGLMAGAVVGGSVVIETVFAWPGAGRLIVNAVLVQDFPVIQVAVLFVALIVVLANMLVDITYSLLDPRVQYGS